ncbi:MAG: peptide chain release factor 2 [Candidatus Dojkabacteria bacterium]|nr:peptide chain release factor 2 [Candidatus Dojkabacteria bacterium]
MVDLSKRDIKILQDDIYEIHKNLDIPTKRERVSELEQESLKDDFWKDSNKAQSIMSQIRNIRDEIDEIEKLKEDVDSLSQLFLSTEKETDQNLLIEEYQKIRDSIDRFSIRKFLSDKYDVSNTILSIHAGQGGVEANDWTEMLYRMYTKYCDKQGWKYEIVEMQKGDEAGIGTVTIKIFGQYSYGLLKREHGAHRLVRVSPYNAQGLRQTTFAGVEVLPILEDLDKDIVIPESDLEFKATKSGGPGGQNVNKTSSAVHITHIPTGITVHCSSERSQAQNRENAMSMLKAKLWRIKNEERVDEISQIKGNYKIAGWGNQIRNYILNPYKLVKDLRTNIESSNPEDVLDGNIDKFVEAQVRLK